MPASHWPGNLGRVDRLLLVEDDTRIGSSLQRAPVGAGYEVVWVTTGAGALEVASGGAPPLVILDLGPPDMDGLDVCRACQAARPNLPVVILTARDEEIDVVLGLDSGAVDYVTKPFKLAELLARIRAHLRKSVPAVGSHLQVGDLAVDPASRRAWLRGDALVLRAREFDLHLPLDR